MRYLTLTISSQQSYITYDDIIVSIRMLNAIAAISKAVDTGHPDLVYEKLSNSDAYIFVSIVNYNCLN